VTNPLLERFVDALFARHLAELTFSEVRKSLQALSSLYVERREKLPEGAVFDGRGTRAAFAVFYGPLHFETARLVAGGLGLSSTKRIVDLGCGTGAAGAGLALALPAPAPRHGRRAELLGRAGSPLHVRDVRRERTRAERRPLHREAADPARPCCWAGSSTS
jgi:hypothetical protein